MVRDEARTSAGNFGKQGREPVRNMFGETRGSTAIVEAIVDLNGRAFLVGTVS